jgi:hypothetical protein
MHDHTNHTQPPMKHVVEVYVKGTSLFAPSWVRQPGEHDTFGEAQRAAIANGRRPYRIVKVARVAKAS